MAKKYIDADRLREYLEKEADKEFKKTEENANSPVLCHFHNGCRMQALDTIDFIDSLQQEQSLPGTEELMQGIPGKDFIPVEWVDACEKYGKWKIVKVEQPSEDLEEATARYGSGYCDIGLRRTAEFGFRSGAEWQRQRTPMPEDTVLFNKGVAEGRRLERQDMLKDAVEGYVNYYEDSGGILMAEAQVGCPYHNGDKVKIVIIPIKEDKE